MKNLVLSLFLFLFLKNSQAQLVLEKTYAADSLMAETFLMSYVNVGPAGYKFVNHRWNGFDLYNSDHSLYKSITYPEASYGYGVTATPYISQTLVNDDDKIEYIVTFTGKYAADYTIVADEDGKVLLKVEGTKFFSVQGPENDKKIIFSMRDGNNYFRFNEYRIYSTKKPNSSQETMRFSGNKAYPNPATMQIKIPYELDSASGELQIFSFDGKLLKNYSITKAFDHFLMDTSGMAAGTYIYKIWSGNSVKSGKFIIETK